MSSTGTLNAIKRLFSMLARSVRRLAALLLVAMGVGGGLPPSDNLAMQVVTRVGALQFDFVTWTLDALGLKLAQASSSEQSYLPADSRRQAVLDYFELLEQSLELERQIDVIFTNPDEPDPDSAARDLIAQLALDRKALHDLAPIAEAVMQEQIGAILAEQGFALGGQIVPPIAFHITALPGFLIISPRERIELAAYANLEPGLTALDETRIEAQMENDLGVSALVVPLGGLGTYPTMIYQTSNLNYTFEVGAHEWAHNYLTLRPLGITYEGSPEVRTMNEVTATLFGQEIGRLVVARYYPELLPPPPPTPHPEATAAPTPAPDPDAFDFNAEMHATRVTVDTLLAEGKVEEAEAYMESRRRMFVARGYNIRKLNQAYFAFYGAYNVGPGAGGQDPVGPAVRALRSRSPSLRAFMDQMSWMTSFDDLQAALGLE